MSQQPPANGPQSPYEPGYNSPQTPPPFDPNQATGGAPNYYAAPGYQQAPMRPQKSALAAGLLGIFLGGLGIHNFYLGRTGLAVAQLLISLLSFGLLAWASALWGFIEGILYLVGSSPRWNTDAAGVPLSR